MHFNGCKKKSKIYMLQLSRIFLTDIKVIILMISCYDSFRRGWKVGWKVCHHAIAIFTAWSTFTMTCMSCPCFHLRNRNQLAENKLVENALPPQKISPFLDWHTIKNSFCEPTFGEILVSDSKRMLEKSMKSQLSTFRWTSCCSCCFFFLLHV